MNDDQARMEVSGKQIVLFDGMCNLCSGAVQFIIRHDPKKHFYFASLQSDTAEKLLQNAVPPKKRADTIMLIKHGRVYTKSGAVLRISQYLKGAWKLVVIFLIIPPFIRDGIYDLIARKRYQWFGRRKECMIPAPEWQDRFLS